MGWSIKRGTAFSSVLLLANGLYFLLATRTTQTERSLEHGSSFAATEAATVTNQAVSWKGRWLLLIYFATTSGDGLRAAKYVEVLRHRSIAPALTTIALMDGTDGDIQRAVTEGGVTYPVAKADAGWKERLGIHGQETAAVLVNPQRIVEFAAYDFRLDDLRQIVERHFTGRVVYDAAAQQRPLRVGDDFPVLAVGDALSSYQVKPPPSSTIILVTARCSLCTLETNLAGIRSRLNSGRLNNRQYLLILSSKFTTKEIADALHNGVRNAKVIHAARPIEGLEDEYTVDGLFPSEVLVLHLGPGGAVTYLDGWEAAIATKAI